MPLIFILAFHIFYEAFFCSIHAHLAAVLGSVANGTLCIIYFETIPAVFNFHDAIVKKILLTKRTLVGG
jgi:hypothetical protein